MSPAVNRNDLVVAREGVDLPAKILGRTQTAVQQQYRLRVACPVECVVNGCAVYIDVTC